MMNGNWQHIGATMGWPAESLVSQYRRGIKLMIKPGIDSQRPGSSSTSGVGKVRIEGVQAAFLGQPEQRCGWYQIRTGGLYDVNVAL